MEIQKHNLAGYDYAFVSGDPSQVLLLLHGTGGNELDLLQLGRLLQPDATIISPRGNVLEQGHPRFFLRLAEGVFDTNDVVRRAGELTNFIVQTSKVHSLNNAAFTAMGYSNGANIAAAAILLHPGVIKRAVLFRAMWPIDPPSNPALEGTTALLLNGAIDAMIPRESSQKLANYLEDAGASIEQHWLDAAHGLLDEDIAITQRWLGRA